MDTLSNIQSGTRQLNAIATKVYHAVLFSGSLTGGAILFLGSSTMPENDKHKMTAQYSGATLATLGGLGLLGMVKEAFLPSSCFLNKMRTEQLWIEQLDNHRQITHFESVGLNGLTLDHLNEFRTLYYGPIKSEIYQIIGTLNYSTDLPERAREDAALKRIISNTAGIINTFRKDYFDDSDLLVQRNAEELSILNEMAQHLYQIATEVYPLESEQYKKLFKMNHSCTIL